MEEQEPSIFPLEIGETVLTRYDGASYVDDVGRTYYSGAAEPSEQDAQAAVANPVNPPEVRAVPFSVRAWRLRAVAKLRGIDGQIEAAFGRLPEPQQTLAREAFNDSDVERAHALTILVYQEAGFTSEEVDDIFREANSLA